MNFDRSRAVLAKLLDYHDSGFFALPPEAIEARAAVEKLEAFAATIPNPDPEVERAGLVDRLCHSARTSDKWPGAGAVVKATAAATESDELRQATTETLRRLTNATAGALSDADGIIVGHLRPAHDDAIATAQGAIETITAADADPLDVLRATAVTVRSDLQSARHDLDRSRRVYSATRDARQRLVTAAGGQQHDGAGEFAWCRNLAEVWPGHQMYMSQPPWPTDDPSAHFCWLLSSPLKLWLPTLDEADTAWNEAHADDVAARSNAARIASGAVFVRS